MTEQLMLKAARSTGWLKIVPWACSGASTAYAVVRAHRLSQAEASSAPLLRFVLHHSDLVMVLCGSTAVWYAVARRNGELPTVVDPQLVRQLRQVLSALMLGIGLLERRIEQGAYANLNSLVQRLHGVVRHGAVILDRIEQSPTLSNHLL